MTMAKDTSEDDQVSLVLEHFQPEAAFQTRGSISPNNSNRKKKKSSSFASVRYHANTQTVRLVYLYPGPIKTVPLRLEFHVNVTKPHRIRFVPDKYSSGGAVTDEEVQLVCDKISSNTTNTTLFWMVSKLLLELDNLLLSRPKIAGNQNHLVKRLISNRRTCWDLPLFLMRCATTSKKSSKVCTLPASFGRETHAAISLLHIRDNLLPHYEKVQSTVDEHSLIAYLASLQWTENVQISTDNNVSQLSTIQNTREQGNISPQATAEQNNQQNNAIRVTLDLTKGARDPTPRFVHAAQTRGTIKAFHGTAYDNIWSILTFGLQTHPTLQINGALMGEAVYLSDKYDLAYFYATKDGNGTKCLPRPHWYSSPSFWNVLVGRQQHDNNGWSKVPAFVREAVQSQKNQHYHKDWDMDVTCYAVVECSIIQPPPKSSDNQDTTVTLDDKLRAATKHQGHIYAVPDPNDSIHMEKVHLTFEFSRRRRLSSLLGVGEPTMMGIGVVAVILILFILRQHS